MGGAACACASAILCVCISDLASSLSRTRRAITRHAASFYTNKTHINTQTHVCPQVDRQTRHIHQISTREGREEGGRGGGIETGRGGGKRGGKREIYGEGDREGDREEIGREIERRR